LIDVECRIIVTISVIWLGNRYWIIVVREITSGKSFAPERSTLSTIEAFIVVAGRVYSVFV
jgi:hypothetical protein